MPYEHTHDLPDSVTEHLPEHAQEIYKEAFNSAWKQYDQPDDRKQRRDREETAHAVAWSAVKKKYEKNENTGVWSKREDFYD